MAVCKKCGREFVNEFINVDTTKQNDVQSQSTSKTDSWLSIHIKENYF